MAREKKNSVLSIEKFLRVKELVDEGVLSMEEGSRGLGISLYMWRKWATKYKDISASDICEYGSR